MSLYRANIHMRRVDQLQKDEAWSELQRFKSYRDSTGRILFLEDTDVYHNRYDAARALACALVTIAKDRTKAATKLLDHADRIIKAYGIDAADTPYFPRNA